MGRITRQAENRCIRLFQGVLGDAQVQRQYTGFEFLRGDPTPNRPDGVVLPVDAYFPDFNLVIEYLGRQHFQGNELMERRAGRREQRRKYQNRRAQLLPAKGVRFVQVRYDEPLTEEMAKRKLRGVGIETDGE